MDTHRDPDRQGFGLSKREERELKLLQSRYEDHPELFSSEEIARLHFMRWLKSQGKLAA